MRLRHLLLFVAAVAGLSLADRTAPRSAGGGGREKERGPYPSDWFGLQRAFPYDRIPQKAWDAAVEQARFDRAALERARSGGAAVPADLAQIAALQWQQAGPYNIGGRVSALAVAPGATTIYLGAANGGVFKSVNSGANWTPVFEEPYSIGALALHPLDPNVVYVGTGEANSSVDSYDGAGVFRTADGGATWSPLGLAETRRIARIAVDPQNPSRIFVAAMGTQFSTGPDRGLYRSEDGGHNWTKVLFVSDSTGATDVAINPAHPETVYCATWERVRHYSYRRAYGPECGIWRSADHGTTWTRLSTGLPAPSDNVGRIALGIAPSRPSTIYAQIGTGTALGYQGYGLYRSLDGGTTWARRDVDGTFPTVFGGFVWYFGDMAVDPANPDIVYALGVSLIRSTNGGANWSFVTGDAHVDQHALWIDPTNTSRLYLGNDGGFYSSVSGGGTWSKSVDLPITQFYAGSIDPSNPSRLVGGTQDNDCLQTAGSPTAWTSMNFNADGFYVLVDPLNPNIVFGEYQFCSYGEGPQRSTNGGASFPDVQMPGIVGTDRFNWCTPFVMDPQNHNVLLVGSQRVYRSVDNGLSYSVISPDLTANLPSLITYHTITTLDVSPRRSGLYYAGTDDGRVWRTFDGGTNWVNVSAGLPVRTVTRLTADPAADSTVYVTLSGFGQDEHLAHVYRSTDAGNTWTSIAGNLPDVPANDVLVDPAAPATLYLATDVGVYVTRNLGATWYPLGQGLPVQTVFDLTLHPASRTLVAATHGRSQWRLDLTSVPTAVTAPPLVAALTLSPPVPNPSQGLTRIALDLASPAQVSVEVLDVAGRRVRTLYSGFASAGRMSLSWDGFDTRGSRASAGVYFVRATAAGATRVQRLVRAG